MSKHIILSLCVSLTIMLISGYNIFLTEKVRCECELTHKTTKNLYYKKIIYLTYDCGEVKYSTAKIDVNEYDNVKIGDKFQLEDYIIDNKKGFIRAISILSLFLSVIVFSMSLLILTKKASLH